MEALEKEEVQDKASTKKQREKNKHKTSLFQGTYWTLMLCQQVTQRGAFASALATCGRFVRPASAK
jgi:hypothetical protein